MTDLNCTQHIVFSIRRVTMLNGLCTQVEINKFEGFTHEYITGMLMSFIL
jgi:hypothetical protein